MLGFLFFFIKSSRVCYYNYILWDTFSRYLYTVDVFFRRVTSAQLFITPPPPPDIRHLMWTLSKFIILYYSHTTNTYIYTSTTIPLYYVLFIYFYYHVDNRCFFGTPTYRTYIYSKTTALKLCMYVSINKIDWKKIYVYVNA